MNNSKKGKLLFRVLQIAIIASAVFSGLFIFYYISQCTVEEISYKDDLALVLLIASVYAWVLVHIIIHEAGHLVFGLLSGYKFGSFRIGSLMLIKEDDRIKVKRFTLAGTGGQCIMVPPPLKDGRMPVVLLNLGGSIMNLASSLIALLFAVVLYGALSLYLNVMIYSFIWVGFVCFISNALPINTPLISNDGYNAIEMTKNKEALYSFWVQLMVVDMQSRGVRLKDMPDEWFGIPSDEAMQNSMVAALGVFTCNRLMDMESFEEADRNMAHILSIESGMAGVHRNLLICDRIFIELINENRSKVVASMYTDALKKFMRSMRKFPSVLRTEYSIALLHNNDCVLAEKVLADFEKMAPTYPYRIDIYFERALMLKVKKQYEECENKENAHVVFM